MRSGRFENRTRFPKRLLSNCLLALLLVPSVASAQADSDRKNSFKFQGEVQRGQGFEKEIGRGLLFRLAPDEHGWNIGAGPRGEDYAGCVNPPFHGITPLQIQGWHFRSDDNTAARKPDKFLTPGIGHARDFMFVVTAEDQAKSCDDLDKILYIYDENNREHLDALARFQTLVGGKGTLTITSMTLGNLKPGQQAWIESMRFEVSISFLEKQTETKKTDK